MQAKPDELSRSVGEESLMNIRKAVELACVVGLLTAAGTPVAAQATHPQKVVGSASKTGAVDEQVRRMLGEYFKSVERHELSKFLGFFAEGKDLTVVEDKEMYDWKGFVAFAEGFFQQVAEISFDMEKCTVNPLSARVAVVTGVFKGTGKTASGEPVVVHNAFTFVLLKQGDRWRIKHVHESSL